MSRRIITYTICIVGALSLLTGIIAGVSWGILLFRVIMSCLVILLLEMIGILVLRRFLPELFAPGPAAETGTQVDITVGEQSVDTEELLSTETSPQEEEVSDGDFEDPEIDTVQTSNDNKEGHLSALQDPDSDTKSIARAIQTVLIREGNP